MSEEYTKINWQDHIVERPRTYTIMHNQDGTITLTPVPGTIVQQGTAMSAANFNHMENGIAQALSKALSFTDEQIESIVNTTEEEVPAGYVGAAAVVKLISMLIMRVAGASEGHIPVFDDTGSLASSGIALSGFDRAKFSLSGTELSITTVD